MRFVDDGLVPRGQGGLSSPQVKAVSITTLLGTNGALSRSSFARSSLPAWPKTASFQSSAPAKDLA